MTIPRGWLQRFLDEAFPPDKRNLSMSLVPMGRPPPWRLRRALLAFARRRGLRYGAPLLRDGQRIAHNAGALAPLVRLLAVLVDQTHVIASYLGGPPDDGRVERRARSRALAAALAMVLGEDAALGKLLDVEHPALAPKALEKTAQAFVARRYHIGNPLLGLTLNHALIASDAQAVAEAMALCYGARPPPGAAVALREGLARRRAALIAVIASLSAERQEMDHAIARATQLWHVRNLGLARAETQALLALVKSPPDVKDIARLVQPEDRELVVDHAVLMAVLDGRVSPEERRFVDVLTAELGLPLSLPRRLERRVLGFVTANRDAFNPLAHAERFHEQSPPLAARAARVVRENLDALLVEIRETGDLAVLLARRAAGQPLTREEQRRMKEQLVDVVKAVPALAVLSLPGGAVLLPVLLKLLPFDIRTSAFRAEDGFRAFDANEGTLEGATTDDDEGEP